MTFLRNCFVALVEQVALGAVHVSKIRGNYVRNDIYHYHYAAGVSASGNMTG